ncbi:tetratricopeptide repeat protein [Rummeliibacillus sp. POC4]|uniref:tetratricopeptide repeat protein n=1 Tax=Rummeliibacillus sp. POC4 TaxID=2305899 RepID=UPI000E660C8A|nr:tetratricopeptide repeat protein [Rummeliibacillus sp. POC4]RIJ63182.1 tetratricopeptide repeat protein [Rummeliibacillus sp. POC4]
MSNVEKMVEHALELRRTGRYDQALNMYTAAIKEEPSNSNLYRGIGKVAYLMGQSKLAVSAYLSALHIEIAKIEHFGLNEETQKMFDQLPEVLTKDLPVIGAFIIYYDTNTLRHLAHAIADFDDNALSQEPELVAFKEIYTAHLKGDQELADILAIYNRTEKDYTDQESTFYIQIGKELALAWIKWDHLGSLDVGNLYF